MKYIIELNGEESPISIEEVLDMEFGRNCKCKVFAVDEHELRTRVKNSFSNEAMTNSIIKSMSNLYMDGYINGANSVIEEL